MDTIRDKVFGATLVRGMSRMEDLDLNKEINSTFWRDKDVLITGHTGFKGYG